VNNGMMYLFSDIRYNIGGNEMEAIFNPGQTTSMIAYLSQPEDYSTSAGLKSCWSKDTSNDANSNEFETSVLPIIHRGRIQHIIKALQQEEVYL